MQVNPSDAPRCPRCRSRARKRYLNHCGGPYVYQLYCEMCGWRDYGGADNKKEAEDGKQRQR